jgi:hypothetical protein
MASACPACVRFAAVPPQDPLDRVAANLVAEVVQRADQPRVPPGRVLRRHPHDELFYVDSDSGTPGPAARRAIVLAGDQLAVPAQDRVRRDQAGELAQPATTDGPALDGQAPPLVIGEPQAPPVELLAEDAVLLAQEVDDLKLAGVDPARHPEDQEPHSLGAHRGDIIARLVIHLGVRRATTSRGDASRFPLDDFRHTTRSGHPRSRPAGRARTPGACRSGTSAPGPRGRGPRSRRRRATRSPRTRRAAARHRARSVCRCGASATSPPPRPGPVRARRCPLRDRRMPRRRADARSGARCDRGSPARRRWVGTGWGANASRSSSSTNTPSGTRRWKCTLRLTRPPNRCTNAAPQVFGELALDVTGQSAPFGVGCAHLGEHRLPVPRDEFVQHRVLGFAASVAGERLSGRAGRSLVQAAREHLPAS